MDQGGRWTDMYVMRLEKRIRGVYTEAEADIEAKMMDFNRRRNIKDKIKLQELREGKITQEEYNRWRAGQAFQGKQWIAKREQIAEVLYNANSIAAKMANEQKANVFIANANYQAYALEHGAGINFGFNLYDSSTVVNLIKSDPQVLPFYKPKKSKDMDWNMHNITRQITQSIIQGESLDKVAKRLAKVTGSRNMASMLTNARTGMTMAQNAGRQTRLKEATKMGIKVHKEWMCTLDERTRWQHADLDGQKQPMDKPFRVGGYTIMYPGDPTAHPSMVYNCRCTLVGDLDDYPSEYKRYDNIEGNPIKNMTYTEWEAAKKKSKPSANTIINGKDISAAWKRRPDQFDFEIEDVINAQGFDGKPRVVSAEEFDEAVKKSNFVAQRTYSAPDQETLDAYRDQLYDGKWYVDCSTGGAQYGQGMYCAANYTGTLTDGIKTEMSHYKDLGQSRNDSAAKELAFQKVWDGALQSATDEEKALIKREYLRNATDEEMRLARAFEKRDENAYFAMVDKYASVAQKAQAARDSAEAKSYTETLTLDPSAKVITYRELMDIRTGNLSKNYRTDVINDIIKKSNYTDDEATFIRFNLNTGVTWNEVSAAAGRLTNGRIQELSKEFSKIGEEATKRYNEEHARRIERAKTLQHKFSDPGSLATALGYDAINAEGHGQSGSYTVILNRTKCIFKGE